MNNVIRFPSRERVEILTAREAGGRKIYLFDYIYVDDDGEHCRAIVHECHTCEDVLRAGMEWEAEGIRVDYSGVQA